MSRSQLPQVGEHSCDLDAGRVETVEIGLVFEPTPYGGRDVLRECLRHQWDSHPLPESCVALLSECPLCLAEIDGARGRDRYRQRHLDRSA